MAIPNNNTPTSIWDNFTSMFNTNPNQGLPAGVDGMTGAAQTGYAPPAASTWDNFTNMFSPNNNNAAGANAAGAGGNSLFGSDGIAGGIGSLIGGVGGIMGAVNAGKQLKMSRDMFDFSKDSYNQNNALQADDLNRRLADRQRATIAQQGLSRYTASHGNPEEYLRDNEVNPRAIG